jgi:hypothetical protein
MLRLTQPFPLSSNYQMKHAWLSLGQRKERIDPFLDLFCRECLFQYTGKNFQDQCE